MAGFLDKFIILLIFLGAHLFVSKKGWYYKYASVDVLTHFLGGLTLGAFLKDHTIAVGLIFLWELLEAVLSRPEKLKFKESAWNKARDVLSSLLGYLIGFFYF